MNIIREPKVDVIQFKYLTTLSLWTIKTKKFNKNNNNKIDDNSREQNKKSNNYYKWKTKKIKIIIILDWAKRHTHLYNFKMKHIYRDR